MYRILFLAALLSMGMAVGSAKDPAPVSAPTEKVLDGAFLKLAFPLIGATIFDTEATARARARESCYCREGNTLYAPFVNAGRPAMYAADVAMDTAALYFAYKAKKRHSKIWWVPPTVAIGLHVWFGARDMNMPKR